MRNLGKLLAVTLAGVALAGCRDNTPPPPRVAPPEVGRDTYRAPEPAKPLPSQEGPDPRSLGPRPYADEPLMVDIPPEARAFVEVYNKVGRPRIVVLVNRTLDGQIVPSQGDPGPERVTETEHRVGDSNSDKLGPNDYRERTAVYLKPGEYDEMRAKSIDYGLMESQLADWMAADNQVTIVSPTFARKKLSDQELKDLQDGKEQAMAELGRQLDADILIQVQARPTRQTRDGLELRVLAEAVNVKGGESLGRAAVDVYPPLDKPKLNRFTRFIARKLMDGMTQAWTSGGRPGPAPKEGGTPPAKPAPGPGPRLPDAR